MMSGAVAAMRTGSSCSRGKRRGAKNRRSAAGSGNGPLDLGAVALDAATSAGVAGFLPLALPFPLPFGGSEVAAAAYVGGAGRYPGSRWPGGKSELSGKPPVLCFWGSQEREALTAEPLGLP